MDSIKITVDNFLNIYNKISETKLDYPEFMTIFSKFTLILKHISLDIVEMIDLTDTLLEFKKYHQLNKINEETIFLIKKITNNQIYKLEGSLYFSIFLKHLLLPFNLNKCERDYEILLHISKFETLLELIRGLFNNEDYQLLQSYNYELSELVLHYKKNMDLYKNKINKEIMLSSVIEHLYSIFYFQQQEYHQDKHILDLIIENSINNYQQFINYCCHEGIYNNFSKMVLSPSEINKEYELSKNMLDYTFNNLNKEKEKRKC